MATGDKRVKFSWEYKSRQRKKIIYQGNEYSMTEFERIWMKTTAFVIMELPDLEEYEQQVFVWKREVILNLN